MIDPAELLDIAVSLARDAGDVLRRRPADLGASSKSTPTDTVTVMDRAAEKVVLDGLARLRPRDRVVAEESGAHAGDRDDRDGGAQVSWYVDPLDGTVNYLYDLPQWAVSIGVSVGADPVAGVVYDVSRDLVYTAVRGQGARCNDRPLHCTDQTDPSLALVATGFAYAAETRAEQAQVLRGVLPRVRDIRRLGSAALDLCAVAAGMVDGYFEAGMNPWDWAAGALVAREAGARVGGLGGAPPGRHLTLAANPGLFDALERLLLDAGAPAGGDGRAS